MNISQSSPHLEVADSALPEQIESSKPQSEPHPIILVYKLLVGEGILVIGDVFLVESDRFSYEGVPEACKR